MSGEGWEAVRVEPLTLHTKILLCLNSDDNMAVILYSHALECYTMRFAIVKVHTLFTFCLLSISFISTRL